MSRHAGGVVREQGAFDAPPEGKGNPRSSGRVRLFSGLGIAAAPAVYLLLGNADLERDARRVAAVATLMAAWWMTEAIPLSATSLLPIILFPVLTERTGVATTAPYADPIIFLCGVVLITMFTVRLGPWALGL